MTIKSKVLAAAATLTLVGGVGTAGVLTSAPANAATPSCGPHCIDLFSKNFGSYFNPQFVMDVLRQKEAVGQPIILFRESNADPAEDFTFSDQGTVADFYAAGLVGSSFALHYGCTVGAGAKQFPTCLNSVNLFAFEVQYAPYGVDSGLCVGATSPVPGSKVALEPCGQTAGTVWAVDTLDSCPLNPLYFLEAQAINGLDVNFSLPSVLTYPASAFPTDKPRAQFTLQQLAGFSQDGNPPPGPQTCGGLAVNGPDNNQLFGAVTGILP